MRVCPTCGKCYDDAMAYCSHDGTSLLDDPSFTEFRSPSELQPGTVVGKYRIVRQLGAGGMAIVYEAEHVQLGRRVAIKALSVETEDNVDIAKRFFAEARAANEVGHENIVEIIDFAEERGFQYCVMELLKGAPLSALLAGKRPLPLARTVHIASQLADALAAVHRAGIVHRDLKPENIFLTERAKQRDFVKLLDFGVAKILDAQWKGFRGQTRTGYIIGTPAYIAPEQMVHQKTDHRADIYAFGVILYEMCTGRKPFEADNVADLLVASVHDTPPAPSEIGDPQQPVPAPLEALILECLAKRPDQRPRDMEEVLEQLHQIAVEHCPPEDVSGTHTVEETELLPVVSVREQAHSAPTAPVSLEDPTLLFRESEIERAERAETAEAQAVAPPPAAAPRQRPAQVPRPSPPRQADSLPPEVVEAIKADRRAGVWTLAIMVLALAGIATAVALLWPSGPGEAETSASGVDLVTVALSSSPPGALVFVAGQDDPIGVTPLRRPFPRAQSPLQVEFRLEGYRPARQLFTPGQDAQVAVVLELAHRPDAAVAEADAGSRQARADAGRARAQLADEEPAGDEGEEKTAKKKKRRKRPRAAKDEQSGIEGLVDPFSE